MHAMYLSLRHLFLGLVALHAQSSQLVTVHAHGGQSQRVALHVMQIQICTDACDSACGGIS